MALNAGARMPEVGKAASATGSAQILIRVVPLGPLDHRLLQVVAANVFALYDLPARVARGSPIPPSAYDGRRQQYDAAALLKHLDAPQTAGQKTIAVTAVDIFVPIFSHVFGEARLGGAAALVSIHRLSGDGRFTESCNCDRLDRSDGTAAELYLRAVKVALHELGHLFRISHCEDSHCLMHYADTLTAIDRTPLQFCRYCRAGLPVPGP
ncbi:MAG: zinc metallopeptidase [Desulfosarcinaceae bacterium]|jgi:archaemetzincin